MMAATLRIALVIYSVHHLFYFVAAFYNYSLIQFGLSEKER